MGLLALAYTNRSVTRKDGAKLCNYITDVELVNKDLKIMKFWFEPDACYQVRFNAKV